MKKIILALIIVIQAAAFSQDAFITIGKLKLRYDADSNYLRLGYSGTLTGNSSLRIGKELNAQLFDFNTNQFSWSTSTGLNLNSRSFSVDSVFSKILSSYKDTTWIVLGEPVTKYKYLSLKKPFFNSNVNNYYDWKYYYRSFDTDGSLLAVDSPYAVNNVLEIDQTENVSLPFDGTYNKIDSLLLDAGTYLITFSFVYERINPSNASAVGLRDTIEIALKEEGTGTNTYIKRFVRDIFMYSGADAMNGGVISWTAKYTTTVNKNHVFLYGRYLATALSNVLLVGVTAGVTRATINAILIH